MVYETIFLQLGRYFVCQFSITGVVYFIGRVGIIYTNNIVTGS